MALRRMFSLQIVDSDAFLDLPLSAQSLYFHLGMRADDDGFISNPKKTMRAIGCREDDFKILLLKKFLLLFNTGVCLVKHWRINNYIRADRYHKTTYSKEAETVTIKENGSYKLSVHQPVTCSLPVGIPNSDQMETEVRLGKVRLGYNNISPAKFENPKFDPHRDIIDFYLKLKISDETFQNSPYLKKINQSKWIDTIDKLNRIDGHDFETIKNVLEFSVHDPFWCNQIVSIERIRAKGKNGLTKFENCRLAIETQLNYKKVQGGWS